MLGGMLDTNTSYGVGTWNIAKLCVKSLELVDVLSIYLIDGACIQEIRWKEGTINEKLMDIII